MTVTVVATVTENRHPHSHPNPHKQLSANPVPPHIPCYLSVFFNVFHQFCQYSRCSVPEYWCVSTCPLFGKSNPDLTKSGLLSLDATLCGRQQKKMLRNTALPLYFSIFLGYFFSVDWIYFYYSVVILFYRNPSTHSTVCLALHLQI